MARTIKVTTFLSLGDNKYEATGTLNDRTFLARTIMYQGQPIFKVQETDAEGTVGHLRMRDSGFSRGDRISLARYLKKVRLGEIQLTEDLTALSVKELRARCKEAGLRGYHKRGVRKDDLVNMLSQAS